MTTVCEEKSSGTQAAHVLEVPKDPSLWDIELANIQAASVPERDRIVLQIPRNIRVNLLADVAISKLIATLQERSGELTIRDYYDSWTGTGVKATRDRFLREVDGATALVYCASTGQGNRLENRRKEAAPDFLRRDLIEHVARTGYLEELVQGSSYSLPGPSRTFFAVDPEYAVPPGMTMSDGKLQGLYQEVKEIYRQFGSSFDQTTARHRTSLKLYEALYEIFQNSFDHGRRFQNGAPRIGVRFIRFYKYFGSSNQDLARRAVGFEPLRQYLERRESKHFKFLEVTVGDAGPGILSHFSKSAHAQQLGKADAMTRMNQILTTNLSSKLIPGAGLGLPLALSALASLRAFASLRSDNLWLYRDFSVDPVPPEGLRNEAGGLSLRVVPTEQPLARMAGTHFSVLIDFPN
jgi:hypothetical protein